MTALPPGDLFVTAADWRDPATCAELDAFVLRHPGGTPFHRPAWLAAVAKATANDGHMFVARDAAGRIRGLLPLTAMRSRLFGAALVSTAFAVDGGLLVDDEAAVPGLVQSARQLADRIGCRSLDLRGGPAPGADWTHVADQHVGFSRPIAADDAQELTAIPRKHRAELRKALANADLRVEHGVSARLLRDHYHVYATSVRNLGTPVFPRALFVQMLDRFAGDADITVIYVQDRPVSAVFSFYHGDRVMPYWGGGTAQARSLRSNELLYFSLMRHARERGIATFDFGRSRAGSGQAAWKRSFGFEPRPLEYHRLDLNGQARDISPDSPKYRLQIAMWKKLPLPVANLLGPLIARGLG